MLKKIEALRKEPVHVRNRWAFWIALSVTLCIAFFWVSTLPARFIAPQTTSETEKEGDTSWRETVGSLKASFTETVQNFRTHIEYVKEPSDDGPQINTLDLDALFNASTTPIVPTTASSTGTTTRTVE